MSRYTKDDVKESLRKGVTVLYFRKKNGEMRTMFATLVPELIPEDKKPKGTGTADSVFLVRCYDLEEEDWRSCRPDFVEHMMTTYQNDLNFAKTLWNTAKKILGV